jgi:hypothetical protein
MDKIYFQISLEESPLTYYVVIYKIINMDNRISYHVMD